MKKKDIKIFGEDSLSVCEQHFLFIYRIRRLCDNAILAFGLFKKYKNTYIRTMYTGWKYGTGEFILETDCGKVFYKFK